jgi:hypothetical protein
LALIGSLSLTALSLAFAAPAEAVGLDGIYNVSNWTTTVTNGGDGSVNTGGAPASIALTSSNNDIGPSNVDFTIAAAASGLVSFNWSYLTSDEDGPGFDPFGYLLNGSFFQLTDDEGLDSQSGSTSFAVTTGDIFGFRAASNDSEFGSATTTITGFAAPVPLESDALPIVGSTLLMAGGLWWKRKRNQAKVTEFLAKK